MYRWLGILTGLLLALLIAPSLQAGGVTYIITRLDDPIPDSCLPTDCSLREAIIAANADIVADTIEFALDGTVELAIAPDGTNDATTGDLNINNPITVQGRGATATVIDGNQLDRVIQINLPKCPDGVCPAFVINDLTVTGGQVTGNGGGIDAGFYTTLNRLIIRNNSATNYGGGVYGGGYALFNSAITANNAAYGGGVAVHGFSLTIESSTISGNSATANGGGVASIGMPKLFIGPFLGIRNSTVVFNSSNAGAMGAGIGSHLMSIGTEHTIRPGNSIVAYNTGGAQCGPLDDGTPYSPNLTTDGSCETTLIADPQLGALVNNGGNTLTHAPGPNSPALDAGTCTTTTDQRGQPRPVDLPDYPNTANGCDMGAYEAQITPPTAVTLSGLQVKVDEAASILLAVALIGMAVVGVWRWRRMGV